MKLTIDNFAKISHAEILFKGLTVIGGENNTGKSTIGKVLYSIFRGTSNVGRRIRDERLRAVQEALSMETRLKVTEAESLRVMEDTSVLRDLLIEKFKAEFGSRNRSMRVDHIDQVAEDFANTYEPRVRANIEKTMSMSNDRVAWIILRRVFNCVFHGQYHPLKAEYPSARLKLEVQGRSNEIQFHHDHAEMNSAIDLFAHAIMLTDPNVLDYVNIKDIKENPAYAKLLDKNVYELVIKLANRGTDDVGILEEHRKELVDAALAQLDVMICGIIGTDEKGNLVLREAGNDEPTQVQNLSMGMKSLILLRTLLTKGILSERDVLILDEPENHLHPEWQVYYAKALILIQKAYDLTMAVTSHSQFFLNAIQRFIISENIVGRACFYLSKKDELRSGYCTVDNKGAISSDIFRSFNRAYDKISAMSGEND